MGLIIVDGVKYIGNDLRVEGNKVFIDGVELKIVVEGKI